MAERLGWRRWLLVLWACALVFGFSFAAPQAQALDAGCLAQCNEDCGRGNCSGVLRSGCTCYWTCTNGESGSSTCTL